MCSIEINKLYNEDCLLTLNMVASNFFDIIVTSPPYGYSDIDGMRTYDGTPWTYVKFQLIAKEMYRVLKPGGVICWVVNDQFNNGSKSLDSFRQAIYFQELGFKVHDIIYYCKSGVRNPSVNRYHQCVELIFVLSKSKPKTINLIKDRKNIYPGKRTKRNKANRGKDGELVPDRDYNIGEFGTRWNYWIYDTGKGHTTKDKVAFEHPAIMGENLTKDLIESFSNTGDLVYDPFGGSGTTGIVAHDTGRQFVLSEVSKEYSEITKIRFKERFGLDV